MPAVATHADALRLTLASVEVRHLVAVDSIPGVVIAAVAARNGEGSGRLRSDGDRLQWLAPGSATFGAVVYVDADNDGSYLVEDGEDRDKWVRVDVYPDYLPDGGAEVQVSLEHVRENGISHDDVTAGEASAGDVTTHTVSMENDGAAIQTQRKVWIDAAVSGLEISDDGAAWVSPTTEATALRFPDLGVGASDTLHLRRTIGAGASEEAGVVNHLHFSFCGR